MRIVDTPSVLIKRQLDVPLADNKGLCGANLTECADASAGAGQGGPNVPACRQQKFH